MSQERKQLRIALVHDYLVRFGGAERVLKELHVMYPHAPIYTLLADPKTIAAFPGADIRTSFLHKLPGFIKRRYKYAAPLLAIAAEQFDLRAYDIVISSSSAFIKGVITRPETLHIDYCHTPTRFLWDWTHSYVTQSRSRYRRGLMRFLLHGLRMWDFSAAQRPDYIIANSQNVQARIKKFYRRDSEVIYPPVSPARGGPGPPRAELWAESRAAYFLVVSYLQTYKNIQIAVEACTKLNFPLVIIGEGPEKKRLQKIAGPTITFLGWQSDDVIVSYMKKARAFIFPTDEDFGIAPVEAMMAGTPVIALRRGGALEYVRDGINGLFFDDPDPVVLADALRRFIADPGAFRAEVIRESVVRFRREKFITHMREYVNKCYNTREYGTY